LAPGDFHEKPFDEGTRTKLQIFQLYTREWLPVFLSQPSPRWKELHVFDFFAGPGTDANGVQGSPLRILDELRAARSFQGFSKVKVHAHFYDSKKHKIESLKQKLAALGTIESIDVDVERWSFHDALSRNSSILRSKDSAKLLLVDQYGVGQVSEQVFRDLVSYPTTDFLFFISTSTLHRFRDHPAIKQKIARPEDYYHIHRAALDYYRALLPPGIRFYLAPFSIRKEANIYGLIFGSGHPLGMDKFLQVAWKRDQITGEADFDIDRDNIRPDQPKFDLEEFKPTKLYAFRKDLEFQIRQKVVRDENHIMELCFRHGVLRQHASEVLTKLKKEGLIDISWRVPDIRNLQEPRKLNAAKLGS
jgi:three-Cys-motif partner protein